MTCAAKQATQQHRLATTHDIRPACFKSSRSNFHQNEILHFNIRYDKDFHLKKLRNIRQFNLTHYIENKITEIKKEINLFQTNSVKKTGIVLSK